MFPSANIVTNLIYTVLVQFLAQSKVLTDEAHQRMLTIGEPPTVVEQPHDEQHDQQEEGRGHCADDDKCHVRHFAKFLAKLVGKIERPSPLLEMFVTILEKLLFLRYFAVLRSAISVTRQKLSSLRLCSRCSPKLRGCHGIVGGKETGKSGAIGKSALFDDESYRIVGLLQ